MAPSLNNHFIVGGPWCSLETTFKRTPPPLKTSCIDWIAQSKDHIENLILLKKWAWPPLLPLFLFLLFSNWQFHMKKKECMKKWLLLSNEWLFWNTAQGTIFLFLLQAALKQKIPFQCLISRNRGSLKDDESYIIHLRVALMESPLVFPLKRQDLWARMALIP